MKIKTMPSTPPEELLTALGRVRLHYSGDAEAIYFCIPVYLEGYCGVFGDDDGSYEWFVWKGGALQHSDSAYGMPEAALRDVLTNVFGPPSS